MVAEADAETNRPTIGAGGAPVANGNETDVAEKVSTALNAASKPVGGEKLYNAGLTVADIESTLAAASEKLQAAHKRDQKIRKKGAGRFLRALYPKRIFTKFRDLYINTCIMAAEKGDFVELASLPGISYGETVMMSRNTSQRRDQEFSEMLQASLSRQVSISLSRQMSQHNGSGPLKVTRNVPTGTSGMTRTAQSREIAGLHRNASTGMPGLNRQSSSGIAGLNRNVSTGIIGLNRHTNNGRTTFGRTTSSKKVAESNLFSGGREKFLQEYAAALSPSKGGQANNQNSKVASAPGPDISKAGKGEASAGAVVEAGETARPVQ